MKGRLAMSLSFLCAAKMEQNSVMLRQYDKAAYRYSKQNQKC